MHDFLNETGEFTEEFKTALPEMLGEEHKDSKVFDDIPSISALVKSHADTKTALGKKLDNVITKPGENATDEEKATYAQTIAEAAGAPKEASGYEFFKSEKLPEGMERSQATEDAYRALFFKHKVSAAVVKELSQAFEEMQIGSFNSVTEADKVAVAEKADEEQRVFDAGCTKLKTEWPGEKLPANARISLAAINAFADDDLKAALKEVKMYENASDLAAWKKAGVPLNTLKTFYKVGLKTLDASVLGGEHSSHEEGSEKDKARKMYPNTKA